jgi:hypothetical protein
VNLTLDLFAEPEPAPVAPVQAPRTDVVQAGAPVLPPVFHLVLDRRAEASALAHKLRTDGERTCAALRFFWAWKAAGHPAFPFTLSDGAHTEAARAANHILRGVASDRPFVCADRFVEARQLLEGNAS